MRALPSLACAGVLGVAITLIATPAHAIGPVDLEAAARVGVGTKPFSGDPNPLGTGLGARGGVSVFGFYGGVSVMYYFGGDLQPDCGPTNIICPKVSQHALMYGLDLGYTIKPIPLGPFSLRPQLGIGNFELTHTTGNDTSNAKGLYLEPGVLAQLTIASFLIGADANILILPSFNVPPGTTATENGAAFTVHGQIGVKF